MAKLKFELFITSGDEQVTVVVDDKPILFGNSNECRIKMGDGSPHVKALIVREGAHLNVKIFDINYPVNINGKQYKSAKIKKSVFFKIGDIDVISNVEEVDDNIVSLDEVSVPDLPSFVDNDVTRTSPGASVQKESQSLSYLLDVVDLDDSKNDKTNDNLVEFNFDIKFDETFNKILICQNYANKTWDYSGYIDGKDETVKHVPVPEIHVEKNTKSIHVTHMNNGVVLSDGYYSSKEKNIYISNIKSKKNCIQIHDCEYKLQELIHNSDGGTTVSIPNGYIANRISHDHLIEIKDKHCAVDEEHKVVLSKGTSQLIIEIKMTPASIKPNRFFNIDEDLLKSVALSWIPMLLIIGTVMFNPPKTETEEIREKVVLLKRMKKEKIEVQKPEVENTAVSEAQAAPAPKIAQPENKQLSPPPKQKTVVKNTPPKNIPAIKVQKPLKKVLASKKATPKTMKKVVKVAQAKKA
ncbi:MAG: hypothetical protein KDC67_15235, partial [Ignavibacteriae bacterium]|nr:hypothetical protein [Ignavibacteriota bacterium]